MYLARRIIAGGRYMRDRELIVGLKAGLISGLAMAVFLMLYSFSLGAPMMHPFNLIGTLFPTPYGSFFGLGFHFVLAALYGILFFALIYKSNSVYLTLFEGLLFGIFMWAVDTYVILPVFIPEMAYRLPFIARGWFFAHILYGASLVSIPFLEGRAEWGKPRFFKDNFFDESI